MESMEKKKNNKLLAILIVLLVISLIIGIIFIANNIIKKIAQQNVKTSEVVYNVGVIKLKKEPIKEIITFKGTVEGDPQVKVYPSVMGKLYRNEVEEGSYVKADETIMLINRDIIGYNYTYAPVKSPIGGMIIKLYYTDRGSNIIMERPVFEVAETSKIKISLNLGEANLVRLNKEMKVKIISPYNANTSIDGNISSITPFVDSETLTGTVTIKAPNKNNLFKIGMSANIEIELSVKQGYLVPQKAVLMGLNKVYVFINENGIAKEVPVKQGFILGDKAEITGPLKENDELIVDGSFKLNEGSKLKVIVNKQL